LTIADPSVWSSFTLKGTATKAQAPEEIFPLILGELFVAALFYPEIMVHVI